MILVSKIEVNCGEFYCLEWGKLVDCITRQWSLDMRWFAFMEFTVLIFILPDNLAGLCKDRGNPGKQDECLDQLRHLGCGHNSKLLIAKLSQYRT